MLFTATLFPHSNSVEFLCLFFFCCCKLQFFISPSFVNCRKKWQWHPSMKEEAVLMNATQHLKKYIVVCMDNYHLSASNLTTATTAIVNYKKNSSLDASKCTFLYCEFFFNFFTANLKTIDFAPSCDLGFCTDCLSVPFHDGCSHMRNV